MSFLGFANYYREFIKGYADKVYPMQKLMRNKGKKFEWNYEAHVAFENIKRELCEAPVLCMPTENGMYVLDTDASVIAISGILHQEQEWNGRTVIRPIAYGSKVLSDTEMKYGAPKAEMFAVVSFVEKYPAYLGSAPFKLRVETERYPGRSFSVTRNGLCVSVLLNTLDTTVSIQRGKKLGYALSMRTDYEETQNLKKHNVKDCPYHANKDKIVKRINELKYTNKLFSMKSETDDGLSSCSNFPERPSSFELESDKPVLPEIEHLKGKIGEGDFEKLWDVLNRNTDVFSKHKADIGCCNFVEHEIELEEGAVPHREGARRMTPHKSEACRAEIEMLLEYDMIEPSKLPWACGVVIAKKKGGS